MDEEKNPKPESIDRLISSNSPPEKSHSIYERATRFNEIYHVSLTFYCSSVLAIKLPKIIERYNQGDALFLTITSMYIFATLVNLYPMMLQRYNRARISNVLERKRKRQK